MNSLFYIIPDDDSITADLTRYWDGINIDILSKSSLNIISKINVIVFRILNSHLKNALTFWFQTGPRIDNYVDKNNTVHHILLILLSIWWKHIYLSIRPTTFYLNFGRLIKQERSHKSEQNPPTMHVQFN